MTSTAQGGAEDPQRRWSLLGTARVRLKRELGLALATEDSRSGELSMAEGRAAPGAGGRRGRQGEWLGLLPLKQSGALASNSEIGLRERTNERPTHFSSHLYRRRVRRWLKIPSKPSSISLFMPLWIRFAFRMRGTSKELIFIGFPKRNFASVTFEQNTIKSRIKLHKFIGWLVLCVLNKHKNGAGQNLRKK